MSTLHSFSASPLESGNDHSHFFSNSDDDADTASQRSISLSSGPSSPKLGGHFGSSSSTLKTPVTSSFSQQLSSTPNLSTDHTTASSASREEVSSPVADPETISLTEGETSEPSSVVTSFKFDDDSTRPSSMSSGTSFFDQEEGPRKQDLSTPVAGENTYPPHSQMIPSFHDHGYDYTNNRRATDMESLASAATGSSSGTGGRKARPESMLVEPPDGPLVLGVALVDFNHIVGPRVEFFEGAVFEDEELVRILPFLALPDGAHLSSEDYSYFHFVTSGPRPTTIFGISCNRQIASSELLSKGDDVTRSMVQKAVVILAAKPVFGAVRDKLGVVTNAFFNQRRELVHKFRHRTLILLKALILQKKIMFYGHPVERLCTYQYSLVTLIPCLLQTLEDCGSPPLAARAPTLSRPTSLRTSDRKSLLAFVGLPLDVFGKDAFFQPYLPLQQIDIARDTSSWLCGCTNSIVYSQSNYDLLVNIETNTFEFRDSRLERLLSLTPADRKWIDDIVKDVNESWNKEDPTRPAGMLFKGSDDYLRTKFEEYISAALATIKYTNFIKKGESKGVLISEGYDPACEQDFGLHWIAAFKMTQAFAVWDRVTDPMLFDIVEPKHPCIDKPSAVTDIGLQISETLRELKIEQQLAPTREALSSAFSTGSTNFLKAVDGIKGRWPVQRSSSSNSSRTESSTPTETESPVASTKKVADSASTDSPTPAPPAPTSPPRPPSVVAAQVTSDAKATLGAWGTGIGSFFSTRASRFSMSRNISSPPPIPASPSVEVKGSPPVQSAEAKADPPTQPVTDPTTATSLKGQAVTDDHEGVDAAPGV
ncbi:transport protein Avl9-domain-containing protein [Gautieria morchelliformis]|nr:transport protein Avl9-domain-containing protein [Gautieria morchelliformis]